MRKLWMLPLLPLAAFGLVQGYLWYDFKQQVDEAVRMAAPFATISYGAIHTSVLGEVGLDQVVIRPTMGSDEFTVRELRIKAPNLLFFLDAGRQLRKGKFPGPFGVALRGLAVDLDGELFRALGQMQAQLMAEQGDDWVMQLEAVGCGDLASFGIDQYVRAGAGRLDLDLTVDASYDEAARRLGLALQLVDTGRTRVQLALQLDGGERLSEIGGIPRGTLTYVDTGWHKLRNNYCAALNGGTPEHYVERHLSLLGPRLGIGLPLEVAEAYRDFMLHGGTVTVAMNPPSAAALEGLEFHAPGELMQALGLTVALNQVTVDPTRISWLSPAPSGADAAAAAPQAPEFSRPTATTGAPVVTAPRVRYQPVDPGRVAQHLNRTVRVTTADGKVREGELTAADAEQLLLTLRRKGGALSFAVKLNEIERLDLRL